MFWFAAGRFEMLTATSSVGRRLTRYSVELLGAEHRVMSGLMRHNSHTQLSELPGKTLKCVPILLVLLQLAATGQAANAGEWYVAPDGSRTSKGTKESPWDLGSALGGKQKIAPGDTIWLLAGTYARPLRIWAKAIRYG